MGKLKELLAIIAFLLFPVSVFGADVKLAWDYSGQADHIFRMYQGETSGKYTVTKDFSKKEWTMDGFYTELD